MDDEWSPSANRLIHWGKNHNAARSFLALTAFAVMARV